MIAAKPLPLARSPRHDPSTLSAFGAAAAAILNELRCVALRCRTARRTDLFEACAVLSQTPNVARTAYAEALMKSLAQALGAAPVLLRPGVAEVSFDEAWLLRTIIAAQADDRSSFLFLIRSRVPHAARRNLGFLILSVSERFGRI
ncbi:hypothetical protein [Roseobacter sinensis]|uniref:Uncharacterized protein n=1 Tax=Roseobacter sinensis TaxID=2931391 RepID=A0ABT3BGZ6_9RHOB|nr:hypothetical protein [Roseobacter sp. WL0113]MCV3272856.1 hypothetical protein [Roseobacter sp. WL0113]